MLAQADVDAALSEQGLNWSREGDALITIVKLHDFAAALDSSTPSVPPRRRPITIPTSTSVGTRCAWS